MDKLEAKLLKEIADLDSLPAGAYNIRKNGGAGGRNNTAHIVIDTKTDKSGIDIHIAPGTKHESVHIPVIITETGLTELVYNDFYIGEDCDVDIVAGCGIHNGGCDTSQHDGVHTFHVGKNAKVRYYEKHYGEGEGTGKRIFNPQTIAYLEEGASIHMETTQIRGVDSTKRYTKIVVGPGGEGTITEKLLTDGAQVAESEMDIVLAGDGASGRVISRSVAQDEIKSIPAITAECPDAQLIHEAAIGRIAGDQLMKLMTLGLTEEEAEERILNGFLQ